MDKVLRITHNFGFFSCCTIRLQSIIHYFNNNKILPEVVDSSQQFTKFKDDHSKDITNELFKLKDNEIIYEDKITFSNDNREDQFSDYSQINYNEVNLFVEKYFSLSDDVLNIKNNLINKYNINFNNILAVCYRGNDKSRETHIPSYDEMLKKIKEIKSKYPDHRLLIQSDEIEFYDYITKNLQYEFINFEEIIKISKTDTTVPDTLTNGKLEQAKTFLAVMSIMSECSYVILNSGNVGLWVCLFRGNINNVSQFLFPLYNGTKKWFDNHDNRTN